MKFIGLTEVKAHLSAFVDESQHDRVVITRRGKPAALVIGVEGQDLEQVVLGSDVDFWKMIQERRRGGATLSSDDIRRSFGIGVTSKLRKPARERGKLRSPHRRLALKKI